MSHHLEILFTHEQRKRKLTKNSVHFGKTNRVPYLKEHICMGKGHYGFEPSPLGHQQWSMGPLIRRIRKYILLYTHI